MNRMLLVVDVQNDFVTGSLAVPGAALIIPTINRLIKVFGKENVAYTQDWHPATHCSFKDNGGIWPAHCVEETDGSNLVPELKANGCRFLKGYEKDKEAYSGFDGRMVPWVTLSLDEMLKLNGVDTLYVCGIATDYCVRATVLDARAKGFAVVVIQNACVGVTPKTTENAIADMLSVGARVEVLDVDSLVL